MRKFGGFVTVQWRMLILFLLIFISSTKAQQTTMQDYVLFGGKSSVSNGNVTLSSSTNVTGGSIGSYRLVTTTGNSNIAGNIYSGGTITLSNGNTVTGKITAANTAAVSGNILSVGSNAILNGNIDVNGNIVVTSGTVSGKVTHPAGTTYSGPVPGGGNIIANPTLPVLPVMPVLLPFPDPEAGIITSSDAIPPGRYGEIKLSGNKVLTFNGPGIYVFDKITNNGGTNEFVFNFQNNNTGTFRLYIHNDAELAKIKVNIINGGSAAKIFTEVHGNGSSIGGGVCFNIANGSSANAATKWLGTVWAPNGSINVGSGTGNSNIIGALWSGISVNIQSGVNVVFAPYSDCVPPNVNAGDDKPLNFATETQLAATSSTAGVSYEWQALNGGVISSIINTANISVTAAGTYVVTASISPTCKATDTVVVTAKVKSLIGSELQSIYDNYKSTSPPSPFFTIQNDSIYIDVITLENQYANTLALLTSPAYGLTRILSNGSSNYIITGLFPISKLPTLNALTNYIVYVRPYYMAISKTGIVTTAGDVSMRSDLVRQGYALGGEGVKVGVLSNSFSTITTATTNPITNTAVQDVSNGDLPGPGNPSGNLKPVHVLKEYPFISTDEGRAMLQIVHDVAPKAELYFRTGTISAGDFAKGITDLRDSGCNVIVDDITFITEPFLKDGVVAQAVDNVAATGTSYFSAAGNFANKSYENAYASTASPLSIAASSHNFGGGDRFQNITLSPGNYIIVLQWLDDFYSLGQTTQGGTKNDLDIYLTPNTDGTALFGFNRNNTNGDPIEILPFTLNTTINTNVLITNNTPGSNPARFKYIIFRGDVIFNEYSTGNSTIVGQANAQGAIAVGAVRYDKAPPYAGPLQTESFSSLGGTVIGNAVRNKPELVSIDGVNTTVNMGPDYPSGSPDGYSNFFGTSAAAPHAAAIAALIMEGKKKFSGQLTTSPAEIRSILQATATDMYAPGFDFTSGYGLVNADASMRTFAQPRPTLIELNVPSNVTPGTELFTLTVTGLNLSNSSIIYFRDSALATTYVNSNTATALIPAFIGNPGISVYTAPISSSGLDGGSSDTLSFFASIKKQVKVIADNKTKKYAQQMPVLTATILIDGDSIQHTTYTAAELGLTNLQINSNATQSSDVGSYIINPSRVFNPSDPTDQGLMEIYNYSFVQGSIAIEKLGVTVTAQDATIHYGAKIPNASFTYAFDGTGIPDPLALLNSLQLAHSSQIAKDQAGNDILGLVNGQAVTIVNGQAIPIVNGQAVTIVNGQAVTIVNGQAIPIVNGQAITIVNGQAVTIVNNLDEEDVDGLSFLASVPTIQASRLVQNKILVNGVYQTSTTQVVDITQESILKFDVNSAQTSMLTSVSLVSAKGMVDLDSYREGQAVTIVNGQAITIVNGQAVTIVNGQAVTIVNGQAVTIVNGQAIPIVNNQGKTAVVLSESEIGQGLATLKSLNLVTGFDVGQQFLIPGSLVNGNLELNFVAGTLTVLPAVVTVTPTTSQSKEFGASEPVFTYSNNAGLVAADFSGQLGRVSGEAPGTYQYTIGTLSAGVNYQLQLGGTNVFTITKKSITITPNAGQSKIYGDADPAFTFTNNGGLVATNFSGALGRVSGNDAGTYAFTLGTLSAGTNYALTLAATANKFTIAKAPLIVKALDNFAYENDPVPAFNFQLNTLKAGDVNPGVTYTLSPNYSGNAGVYTITPQLNAFANAVNYNISYVTGYFYVNPNGKKAKKLRAYLDCVEEIPNPPANTLRFVAHYYCINDNRTTLYVPIGPDNLILATGAFNNAAQPFIFPPGNTYFNIPFDGNAMTWYITTYESTNSTSTSSSASSTSNKCSGTTSTFTEGIKTGGEEVTDDIAAKDEVRVFPNPATMRATIYTAKELTSVRDIRIADVFGRYSPVKIVRRISSNAVEIDISALPKGVYFVKVQTIDGLKTVSLVKQ